MLAWRGRDGRNSVVIVMIVQSLCGVNDSVEAIVLVGGVVNSTD